MQLFRENQNWSQINVGFGVSPNWGYYDLTRKPSDGASICWLKNTVLGNNVVTGANYINDAAQSGGEYFNFSSLTSTWTLTFPDNFLVYCKLYYIKVIRNCYEEFGDTMMKDTNVDDTAEYIQDHGDDLFYQYTASTNYNNAGVVGDLFSDRWMKTRLFHKYFKIVKCRKFQVPASYVANITFSITRKNVFYNKTFNLSESENTTETALVKGDIIPILFARGQQSQDTTAVPLLCYPKPVILWHIKQQAKYWPRTTAITKKSFGQNNTNIGANTGVTRVQHYDMELDAPTSL